MKEKKKILIFEDDPEDFEKMKRLLESKYSILPDNFEDMAKAIDPYKKESIEDFILRQIKGNYKDLRLILCDIGLGEENDIRGVNGGSVIKYIRNLSTKDTEIASTYTLEIPIFLVTSYADRQTETLRVSTADISFTKRDIDNNPHLFQATIERQISKFENHLKKFIMKPKVFIVHGHDSGIKETVARFLEKLNLEPIILQEQANKGQNILEKLEKNADVAYAVVLYTSCDLGKDKNDRKLEPRARQNVVFEHGYLICKLGREKVCALVEEKVVKPSDIDGILHITLDDKGAWKNELIRNLLDQKIEVDLKGYL